MKMRSIRTGITEWAVILLTALLSYGGQNNHPQSYKAIHEAVEKGDLEEVKRLLEKGADVNAKDKDGWTPFSRAANDGHKEVAELLIAKGADMNTKDNWGETPLYQAVENGHKEVVELSIAKGADVNAKCDDGATLLHMAAIKGNKDIIELLIAKGADALPAPSAGPEEFAEKIPGNLTAIAGDAFKKGYLYFIWCPKEGPFVFKKNSGMMKIPLYYAVNPAKKAEPFSTRLKLIAVDPNKEFQEITGTTNGDTEEGWWAYGIIVPDIYGLRGEGQASMFLIKKSEAEKKNAKPISNIAVVDVVLEKK